MIERLTTKNTGDVQKFYWSKAWRDLAYRMKIEANGMCNRCGEMASGKHLIAHHIKPITEDNLSDPTITLNPDNIEVLCIDCHNKEHSRFGHHEKKVYIVYGSPLSGKSTLVKDIKGFNDLVLDIDEIWKALTFEKKYIKPKNIRFNVFLIRDELLRQIKIRYGQWDNAFIIGGYAEKYARERLAKELGAELIYVEATKEECVNRAMSSGRGSEWLEYIEKWWADYT